MLKIPTAIDKIIWTDCQEKITYQEIEKALINCVCKLVLSGG